jgi:hypothetical protein
MKHITRLLVALACATAAVSFAAERGWPTAIGSAFSEVALPEPAGWMKLLACLVAMAFIASRRRA